MFITIGFRPRKRFSAGRSFVPLPIQPRKPMIVCAFRPGIHASVPVPGEEILITSGVRCTRFCEWEGSCAATM